MQNDTGRHRNGRTRSASLRTTLAIITTALTLAAASGAQATQKYPRLMTMLWNGVEAKDFARASRFDAVEFQWTDILRKPAFIDSVYAMKARNPELRVIAVISCDLNCTNWSGREVVMSDWSAQMAAHDSLWYLRDVAGHYWKRGDAETTCAQGWMNFTQTDMAVAFANYLYAKAFAAHPGLFDGAHFDHLVAGISWIQSGAWVGGGVGPIDSDRNGVADLPATLDARWAAGTLAFTQRMNQLAGNEHFLTVNGGLQPPWFPLMQGRFHEGFPGPVGGTGPDWYRSMWDPLIGYLREPALYGTSPEQAFTLQGLSYFPIDCDPGKLSTTETPVNEICLSSILRLTLASSLLGDGYSCVTGWGRNSAGVPLSYHTTWWFPLYDTLKVNLGVPLGAVYDSATVSSQIFSTRQFQNGYVRVGYTPGVMMPNTVTFELRPKAIFRKTPNSIWTIGAPETLQVRGWDPMGVPFYKLRLLLSRNGGVSYPETLAVMAGTDSVKVITVTGPPTTNARLRVEARDYYGLKGTATTALFTIRSGATGVLAPASEPAAPATPAAVVLPNRYELLAPYPNPSATGTMMRVDVPDGVAAPLRVEVYDVAGRSIRSLVATALAPGRHEIAWDGADDAGRRAGPGIFFVRLTAPGYDRSRRIVLLD